MKTLLASVLVLGAILAGSGASGVGASVGAQPAGIVGHFGSPAIRSSAVHPASSSYTCGGITCAAYEAGVNGFLQDVAHDSGGGNNVYSVATQYSDGTGSIAYNQTFGGTYIDTNAFPANGCTTVKATCLTQAQLLTELNSVVTTAGWSPSSTRIFTILLPADVDTCFDSNSNDGCATNAFCAYHSMSGSMIYAVEPFNASFSCSGAGEGTNPQGLPNGPEIDETVNTLSHETNEAITDPDVATGYYTNQGNENGDLCAWWFGAPAGTSNGQPYNQVINGHDYSLQQEFSNAANSGAGGCVQHLGGTATSATPYLQVPDSGPLVWHLGSVMRSLTTYTVYWIPATTPAVSAAPIVTGTRAVGKPLSTTNGTWTYSPTSYQYKWQRCSNTGTGCVDIASATSSQYTLVTADAGHEIRSEVLASNGDGPAAQGYAASAATGVVVDKPAVVTPPKISGTLRVGHALSVSKGTWTYPPTSYAYQWFRCSSTGAACKKIGTATKASYKLTSADVGHRLVASVTATNAAGSYTAKAKSSGVAKK